MDEGVSFSNSVFNVVVPLFVEEKVPSSKINQELYVITLLRFLGISVQDLRQTGKNTKTIASH